MLRNEVYHGIIGQIDGLSWWAKSLGDDAEGSPGQVDFKYQNIFDREDTHRDVVGFYHTHPNSMAHPSLTDYATMGAWTLCFGRPLVCLIEGVDGLKAHWFIDDEHDHVTSTVSRIGDIFVGNLPDWGEKYIELLNRKFVSPSLEGFEFEFVPPELKGIDWFNDDLFYDYTYQEETSSFDDDITKRWCGDYYMLFNSSTQAALHVENLKGSVSVTVRMPIAFRDCEEMREAFLELMYDRYPDHDFWRPKKVLDLSEVLAEVPSYEENWDRMDDSYE